MTEPGHAQALALRLLADAPEAIRVHFDGGGRRHRLMPQRPVLVLRPEPGNASTVAALHEAGIEACAAPLFAYAPRVWSLPDRDEDGEWRGLLAGSAAIFRHGGPLLSTLTHVPVHAVGASTAAAARKAGFTVAQTGSGGLQRLVADLAPGATCALRRGACRTVSPPGVTVLDRIVYAAEPRPLSDRAEATLRAHATLALLHSGEAARHFRAECLARSIPLSRVALACLAPALRHPPVRVGKRSRPRKVPMRKLCFPWHAKCARQCDLGATYKAKTHACRT
jgi:uroporphyrinogen-III synthase